MKKRSPNIVTFFCSVFDGIKLRLGERGTKFSTVIISHMSSGKVLLFIKFSAILVNPTAAPSVIITLNFVNKKNSCFCCYIFPRQCSSNHKWKMKGKTVWNGEVKWHYDYQKHVKSKFSWLIRCNIFKGTISNTEFAVHIKEEKKPQFMKTKSILLFLW